MLDPIISSLLQNVMFEENNKVGNMNIIGFLY